MTFLSQGKKTVAFSLLLFFTGSSYSQVIFDGLQENFLQQTLWQNIEKTAYTKQIFGTPDFITGGINTTWKKPDTVLVNRLERSLKTLVGKECSSTDYFDEKNILYKNETRCNEMYLLTETAPSPGKNENSIKTLVSQFDSNPADTLSQMIYTERDASGKYILRQTAVILQDGKTLEKQFGYFYGKLVKKTTKDHEGIDSVSWKIRLSEKKYTPSGKPGETIIVSNGEGSIITAFHITSPTSVLFLLDGCVLRNNELCDCAVTREVIYNREGLPYTDIMYHQGKIAVPVIFYYE